MLVGVAVLMGVGGCSKKSSVDSEEPPINIPASVNTLTLVLPLDAYLGTEEDDHTAGRAEDLLFLRCMSKYGFDYDVPDLGVGPYKRNERRYGITTEERAGEYGYHAPEALERSVRGRDIEPVLSDAAQTVADGPEEGAAPSNDVPEGGCQGEAHRQAIGDFGSVDFDMPQRLSTEAFNRSRQDSRVVEAYKGWSQCMSELGYSYGTPDDAMADKRFRTESPTALEKEVALADVKCKQKSSLTRIWVAVDSAYEKRLIEANAQALTAVADARKARKDYWAQVVAGVK
jgi:hypothetical protein